MQINSRTYSQAEFFLDVNNYIRFKTPQIALSGILNPKNPYSPLNKIEIALEKIKNGNWDSKISKSIKYEFRVLGCIIKSILRDQIGYYQSNIVNFTESKEIYKNLIDFLTQLENFTQKMNKLKLEISYVQIPDEIRKAYIFVDKYVSLQILERLNIFIELLVKKNQKESSLFKKIEQIVLTHQNKPSEIDELFQLTGESTKENENYPYWEGLLKKYIQKVLYLDQIPQDRKSKVLQFFYSIGAGFAMILTLLLGYILDDSFAQNSSLYIAFLILIYMLKDRVKDWIKTASNRFFERNFPDHRYKIRDSRNDKIIGSSKESMRFLNWSQLPLDILTIHHAGAKSILELDRTKEEVFKLRKDVSIYTREILEYHERHGDINDIMRFNIRHFLEYVDDPYQQLTKWNVKTQKIEMTKAAQVYYLNLLFRIRTLSRSKKKANIFYKYVQIILDQKGIKRVEEKKLKSF